MAQQCDLSFLASLIEADLMQQTIAKPRYVAANRRRMLVRCQLIWFGRSSKYAFDKFVGLFLVGEAMIACMPHRQHSL
jgi:hypothetical protein